MSAEPGRDPVTLVEEIDMAGTWRRRERLAVIKSDTEGARDPALDMTRRARGVETWR